MYRGLPGGGDTSGGHTHYEPGEPTTSLEERWRILEERWGTGGWASVLHNSDWRAVGASESESLLSYRD